MLLGYNAGGDLTSLTDPNTNQTQWSYDVEGRPTTKQYADSSTLTSTYETTTSRLKSTTDALGQVRQLSYALDDRLTGIEYLGAVNPTPNVGFAYDPYFPRLVSMTDGTGTTRYAWRDRVARRAAAAAADGAAAGSRHRLRLRRAGPSGVADGRRGRAGDLRL
jgi:YD repeat-containing protein